MHRTWFCLSLVLGLACAARSPQAYHYNPPKERSSSTGASPSTTAALRRIILGHLQRFQQVDNIKLPDLSAAPAVQFSRRALTQQLKPEAFTGKQPSVAHTLNGLDENVPPNTPTPKNYAQHFLPDGKDVIPGSSYIPLRLLLIR